MRKNRVKQKWAQGRLALGTYIYLSDPAVVEIAGIAGFDAVFIDMEHSGIDLNVVDDMIRACDLMGMTSLVRVPSNDSKLILRVLEIGAQGVQIPHIAGEEDAIAAVRAVRYAPQGERGMGGPTRARQYGAVPMAEHLATSNAEIIVSAMVEDVSSIDQLAEIAAVDGVDMIAIGPSDLAQSMGIVEPQSPRLLQTIEGMAQTIKKVGNAKLSLPIGNQTYSFGIADLVRLGVAYSNCNPADVSRLLDSYQRQAAELHRQLDAATTGSGDEP